MSDVDELAQIIARCRAGTTSVYMDGSHDRRPSEFKAADEFLRGPVLVDPSDLATIERARMALRRHQYGSAARDCNLNVISVCTCGEKFRPLDFQTHTAAAVLASLTSTDNKEQR